MTLIIEKPSGGKLVFRKGMGTWAEGGDNVYYIEVAGAPYRVHEFKTVTTTSLNVVSGGTFEYLLIGGGSGGNTGVFSIHYGNGGAAGIAREGQTTLTAQSYEIIVGAGGAGTKQATSNAGGSSSAFGITATGGNAVDNVNRTGGSNADYVGGTSTGLGSGGGAGSGANASGSIGGAGFTSSITGISTVRGGGGSGVVLTTPQSGGSGGGGASSNNSSGTAGTANTGSGGGGGSPDNVNFSGGNGGSGIVIVRYAI
jgi:hypothetical protein